MSQGRRPAESRRRRSLASRQLSGLCRDNGRMSTRPSVLLFDLGGVLVDFSGIEDLRPLLPVPLDDEALLARWAACPIRWRMARAR